jgi:hypothetical protein
LATRYTPNRGLLGLSRQSLEEFSEIQGSNLRRLVSNQAAIVSG